MKTVRLPSPAFTAFVTALLGVLQADGGQVFWELNSQSPNLQSDGQPLPPSMRFQLGVFTGGFIPTAANLPEWGAHWRSWDELQYNPQDGAFSRELRFDENPVPFTEGARLYCWGYAATSATGSEYFLATDSSWLVPGTDPLTFPEFVNLEIAGEVILGAAFPDSGTIQTAAVATVMAPAFLFADWRRSKFRAEEAKDDAISGPGADPDHDGQNNLLEYLTGTAPLTAGQPIVLSLAPGTGAAAGFPVISFPSPPSAHANWEFQVSSNLGDWQSESATTSVYDALSGLWKFSPVISPAPGRAFWRLRALSPSAP